MGTHTDQPTKDTAFSKVLNLTVMANSPLPNFSSSPPPPYLSLYHVVSVLPHFAGQAKYVYPVILCDVLEENVQSYEGTRAPNSSTAKREEERG